MSDYLLMISTVDDREQAEKIAETLVATQLAACVNIIPGATSVYQWQGKIEKTNELVLLIKSRQSCYEQVAQCVREHHPYEVPELICFPFEQGLADYLQWLRDNTRDGMAH